MKMNTLKGWLTTGVLVAVMTFGTTFANAGIITAGLTDKTSTKTEQPCTQRAEKVDSGIITAGVTGIITAGLTGIITAGLTGIITAGFTRIIMAGSTDTPVKCGIIIPN